MEVLSTKRLILRPYKETDFDAFAQMHSDPTLKANTHAKPMNRLQAGDLLQGYISAYERDGFGMMSIRLRDDDQDVGECGLWYRTDIGGYTLRYTIRKKYWNQGFSGEAVRAVIADAFENDGMNAIQAIAMQHNYRSIRVLEKAGFVQVSNQFRGVAGFLRFILTAEDYSKREPLLPVSGIS